MSRQLVGAVFIAIAASLFAARHLGALIMVANRTGNWDEQYGIALSVGGTGLLTLSVLTLVAGLVYIAWGEYESIRRRQLVPSE